MHLPTKRTTVKATKTRPYVRRQHYNPEEKVPNNQIKAKDNPIKKDNIQSQSEIRASLRPMRVPNQEHVPKRLSESRLTDQETVASPKSDELKRGEQILTSKLPENLVKNNNMKRVDVKSLNGVYMVKGEDDQIFFQKPKNEEGIGRKNIERPIRDTISGNYSGREIAAYNLSKMVGAETLVPPTMDYGHQMYSGEKGYYEGSAQMSAYDFANRILGHSKVKSPIEIRGNNKVSTSMILNKTKNSSDLMLFDFIQGNTDRHGGNYFLSTTRDGEYNAIAIDNGLSFPEHRGDIIHPDQQNTIDFMRQYFRSGSGDKPIADSFMEGILNFDVDAFHSMAEKQNISEQARNGVIERVKMIQNQIKKKYINAVNESHSQEFDTVEQRRDWLKERVKFSGNDLSNVIKDNFMSEFDANGEEKYAGAFGEWYDPSDQIKELKEAVGEKV